MTPETVHMKSETLDMPDKVKESMGVAKKLTLIILGVIAFVGIIAPWFECFDMDKFTSFLDSYKILYLGLIGSIGVNSALQKYKEK